MTSITRVRVDTAKSIFHILGVDGFGCVNGNIQEKNG
jgi:hypothetical protein